MLRSYSQQNPAQSLRATISFSSDRTPTKGERFLDFMDRMIYENFDDKCYIRHAEKLVEAAIGRPLKPTESPYVRARLLDGFVNGQTSLLIDGDATIDIDTLNRYFCDNKSKTKSYSTTSCGHWLTKSPSTPNTPLCSKTSMHAAGMKFSAPT